MITLKKTMIISVIISIVIELVFLFTYDFFLPFFSNDLQVKNAVSYMILFCILSFILQPGVRIGTNTFVGLEKSLYSLFAILMNVAVLSVLLIISNVIFSMGEFGIFSSLVLADLFQVVVLRYLIQRFLKNKLNEDAEKL